MASEFLPSKLEQFFWKLNSLFWIFLWDYCSHSANISMCLNKYHNCSILQVPFFANSLSDFAAWNNILMGFTSNAVSLLSKINSRSGLSICFRCELGPGWSAQADFLIHAHGCNLSSSFLQVKMLVCITPASWHTLQRVTLASLFKMASIFCSTRSLKFTEHCFCFLAWLPAGRTSTIFSIHPWKCLCKK